jgi:hypothetical protein
MTWWIEIRPALRRTGPVKLVSLEQVELHRGFRTIVAYDDETAQHIKTTGSTKDLKNFPVYADTLFMDFDEHDPVAFRHWLQSSGLAYEEWNSGGRSVHFHLPIEPIFGTWVPVAMKHWTKTHAPTADTSFLHSAGLYRLPGTYHSKYPGHRKELIHTQQGNKLRLTEPIKSSYLQLAPPSGSLEQFHTLLTQYQSVGSRRPHIWLMAMTGLEAGMGLQNIIDNIERWSARFCDPPHALDVIITQCESAYLTHQRRCI